MPTLTELPADARIRLSAIAPALAPDDAAHLISAINKLFEQFIRENRVHAFAVEVLGQGQVLAVGWVNGEGPLSGCSHDKLGQLLLLHEKRSGCSLLDAPPIVIATSAGLRCLDRPMLKTLVARGEITPASIHWDLRVDTVQAWKALGQRPARDTWLGPVIERAQITG